jgi:adenylate cyclase
VSDTARPDSERRLAAVMVADVAGYSRLMGEDDVATLSILTAHRALFDQSVTQNGGRVVNSTGDSILAEFGSAVAAVRCAVEIQNRLKAANTDLPENRRLQFRLGIHVGDEQRPSLW